MEITCLIIGVLCNEAGASDTVWANLDRKTSQKNYFFNAMAVRGMH